MCGPEGKGRAINSAGEICRALDAAEECSVKEGV